MKKSVFSNVCKYDMNCFQYYKQKKKSWAWFLFSRIIDQFSSIVIKIEQKILDEENIGHWQGWLPGIQVPRYGSTFPWFHRGS